MTDWEPATEAEAAMREALRKEDQEAYFQVLARTELLLPVSGDTPAGGPLSWGTWTTGGRTHVLAFTSAAALRACLAQHAGSTRHVPYQELAAGWPNVDWWLAVNPGLPIEGYLPAWFVAQLARGDVRLPGRTMGARARLMKAESANRARATASVPGMMRPSEDEVAAAMAAPGVSHSPGTLSGNGLITSDEPSAGAEPDPAPDPTPEPEQRANWAADYSGPSRWAAAPESAGPPAPLGPPTSSGGFPVMPGPSPDTAESLPTRPLETFGANGDAPPPRYGARPAAADAFPPRAEGDGLPRRPVPEPADTRPPGFAPLPAPDALPGPDALPARPVSGGGPESSGATSLPRRPDPGSPAPFRPAGFESPVGRADAAPRTNGLSPRPAPAGSDFGGLAQRPEPGGFERRPEAEPDAGGPPRPGADSEAEPLPKRPPNGESLPKRPSAADALGARSAAASRSPGAGAPPSSPEAWSRPGFDAPPSRFGDSLTSRPGGDPLSSRPGDAPPFRAGAETPTSPAPEAPASDETPAVGPGGLPRRQASSTPTVYGGAVPVEEATDYLRGAAHPGDPAVEERAPHVWAAPGEAPSYGAGSPSYATPRSDPPYTPDPDRPFSPAPTPAYRPESQIAQPDLAGFTPANEVEEELLAAAGDGSTDSFLSTLLLARVLLPLKPGTSASGGRPGDPDFAWRTDVIDGERYVVVFTSPERLGEHLVGGEAIETVGVKFARLIRHWPDPGLSFAVNPGSPVGATLPGSQIVALASWAKEVGLGEDAEPDEYVEPTPAPVRVVETPAPVSRPPDPNAPTVMQKTVSPAQVDYFLNRGYDRVSGFLHRANEVEHLGTPGQLLSALGLIYPGSPFRPDAEVVHVLRWPAFRPSLYRIPYGGQNENAMRAMEGWVIERPPFRGNGFAPGDSSDVIAEFKVDSVRLPHGSELWSIDRSGRQTLLALLDTDAMTWRKVGEN
ncbi:SseB family protein [Catenuloplanes atrovinosus]|uniref:SseB protein N-terminal domain-containing protein n=1 Tax=Catenuloplanes atrovinosus TaxID=137266 RepID=A0AAE3YTN6_9ACTN|nr:SseB family protein [Catenuloplanes atrovinosus]MDR7279679.1 hypothetical protein [Catenuloplanes atrovinosus]